MDWFAKSDTLAVSYSGGGQFSSLLLLQGIPNTMKITIIQSDVIHKNRSANFDKLSETLSEVEEVGDIVLLPELFATGYIFDTADEIHALSENYNRSPSIDKLSLLAQQYNTVMVAGIAEQDGNEFFNTVAVVSGSGLICKYRKISQTNVDRQYFSRGNYPITFEHKGFTFAVAICFDIWFPEIIRHYINDGVDVLLHPANFGGEQSLQISTACAIENNIYIATCNRVGQEVGKDFVATYCGSSQVCNPNGEHILKLNSVENVQTINISKLSGVKKVIGVNLNDEIKNIKKQLINIV